MDSPIITNKMILSDKEIVDRLLSNNDPAFESFFFNKLCMPLLSKTRWDVFDNQVPIGELTNELFVLLKNNNWSKLRTFGFKSTLFGWLKIVSKNHFRSIESDLMPKESFIGNGKEELDIGSNSIDDVKCLLNKVAIPSYRNILWMRHVDGKTDEEICKNLSVSEGLYQKLKLKADKHLFCVIKNEGEIYVNMFLKYSPPKNRKPEPIIDPTEDIASIIDIERLINLLPDERNRFVIASLLLKDMEVKEVANILGTSVDNIYVIKCKALKQLAEMVRKEK